MGTLRLTAITSDDVDARVGRSGVPPHQEDTASLHAKPTGGRYEAPRWRREKVPPPPDYSTPQAVTARCRERGSEPLVFYAPGKDTTVARAYRAFMKACGDWRDATPAAPHMPGVGRRWDAKRIRKEREKIASERSQRKGG